MQNKSTNRSSHLPRRPQLPPLLIVSSLRFLPPPQQKKTKRSQLGAFWGGQGRGGSSRLPPESIAHTQVFTARVMA